MSCIKEIRRVLAAYRGLKAEGTPAALATVIGVAGSSYRRIGARLLVAADGRCEGGISGGCLEGDALRRAQRAIFTGTPSVQVYDTLEGEDRVIGIGLGCNGRIEVLFQPLDYTADNPLEQLGRLDFSVDNTLVLPLDDRDDLVEYIPAPPHLYIVGHNYDLPPLLDQCALLEWDVTLVGPAKKYDREIVARFGTPIPDNALPTRTLTPRDAVIFMTHDYNRDLALLAGVLALAPHYLGVLGPRKRMAKLADELGRPELTEADFLYAPIGLDIGALDPYEIALAIVAEVLSVRRRREGTYLRRRGGAIHAT